MKPIFIILPAALLLCLSSINDLIAQVRIGIQSPEQKKIRSALLFYVDFDQSFDAFFSRGSGKALIEVDQYEPMITTSNGGKYGEAAAFYYEDQLETIWTKDVVRFSANDNFPYKRGQSFDGAIGMWLKEDLEQLKSRSLIWLDPVHLLAEKDRNNGKIWMDFVMSELPKTPVFRFGATTPKDEHGKRSVENDHVIVVPHVDLTAGDWHQVIGTWKNLNRPGGGATLCLYFDGIRVGEIADFEHLLNWQIEDWEIRIGLGFKGKIDDFFILDAFLSQEQVSALFHAGKSLEDWLDSSRAHHNLARSIAKIHLQSRLLCKQPCVDRDTDLSCFTKFLSSK